jgi:predicted transcriptional regulator
MGTTKNILFSSEQNEIAGFAKAIASPARVAILQHLIKANSCINSDLVTEIGLAQSTISQHLKELKNVGLIQGNIEGTSVNYCISANNLSRLSEIFNNTFAKVVNSEEIDCC